MSKISDRLLVAAATVAALVALKHSGALDTWIKPLTPTASGGEMGISGVQFSPELFARQRQDPELEKNMAAKFNDIYERKVWGRNEKGEGFSGQGSTREITEDYRNFVAEFIKKNGIKTVLDIPCGLWSFSQYLDWGPIKYIGLDIVPSVVERNRQRHGNATFTFGVASLTSPDLPPADLVLTKDALQHLPLAVGQRFLNHSLAYTMVDGEKVCKYRYLLITSHQVGSNRDIDPSKDMAARDLTRPPFNLKAPTVLTFSRLHSKATQMVNLSDPFYGCTRFVTA